MNEIITDLQLNEKLHILADAAKYDVACTSSGSNRRGTKGKLGNSVSSGICHTFAADGRCVSLLKILMTNHCIYDCKYCLNRCSNDVPRATFTPDEICELTIEFYKRNYIEGLFLSSGVIKNPTYTMDKIYVTLWLLREKYRFNGYIHVKAIPGAPEELISAVGFLADRISVNLELPTVEGLRKLAPNKNFNTILKPMSQISHTIAANRISLGKDVKLERSRVNSYLEQNIFKDATKLDSPWEDSTLIETAKLSDFAGNEARKMLPINGQLRKFAPAGQSTQMIIGATDETDYSLVKTTQYLYQKYDLKRVFYSAYIPINEDSALPQLGTAPPLMREHRLYQADWLMRYYGFHSNELLSKEQPYFNEHVDPKCDWALRHLEDFPVDTETASFDQLLRVPGIGPKSAMRIVNTRRYGHLTFESLKKMGVVLKRAHYFITCGGKMMYKIPLEKQYIIRQLTGEYSKENWQLQHQNENFKQMNLFDDFGIVS